MTIDPAFLELMSATVVMNRLTGEDSFGNNTYDDDETVMARVETLSATLKVGASRVGTTVGDPGRSVTLLMDYTEPAFTQGDKATISDTGVVYRVVAVNVEWDERGPYYQALTCENIQE